VDEIIEMNNALKIARNRINNPKWRGVLDIGRHKETDIIEEKINARSIYKLKVKDFIFRGQSSMC